MKVLVGDLVEDDTLVDLDNGWVFEVTENSGYFSYPATNTAMPEDTILIGFHDSDGNENYLLASPTLELEVRR